MQELGAVVVHVDDIDDDVDRILHLVAIDVHRVGPQLQKPSGHGTSGQVHIVSQEVKLTLARLPTSTQPLSCRRTEATLPATPVRGTPPRQHKGSGPRPTVTLRRALCSPCYGFDSFNPNIKDGGRRAQHLKEKN